MSVLPDLVSPRPGVPKPPARDPGGRGLHAVPSRAPTRLCVSGSEVPPSQPSSSADEKAGLLCWGPGQEPSCRPPAGLPSPGVPQAPLCPRPVWGVAAPASRALAPGTKSRVDSCPLAAPPCGGRESLDGSCPVTWSRLPWVPQGPAGSSVTPASHTAVERLVSTVPAKQCRGDSPTQSSMASSLSQARAGATARPPTPCQ